MGHIHLRKNHVPNGPQYGGRMRITGLVERLRDSGVSGRSLAAILVALTRQTVWPLYLKLRQIWVGFAQPPEYTWILSTLYFAFWLWVLALLAREGKRYSGMIFDVGCGGALITVAVVLHDSRL